VYSIMLERWCLSLASPMMLSSWFQCLIFSSAVKNRFTKVVRCEVSVLFERFLLVIGSISTILPGP